MHRPRGQRLTQDDGRRLASLPQPPRHVFGPAGQDQLAQSGSTTNSVDIGRFSVDAFANASAAVTEG